MRDPLADLLAAIEGFDWDAGNEPKLLDRHGVASAEVEQAFFQVPLLLANDLRHSATEPRFVALGRTAAGRLLCIVFTVRGDRVRPISAKDMNRRERAHYAQAHT